MTDYLASISLGYTLLKDTLKIALRRPEIARRRVFQERIVFIQKCMVEVINNGQKIFDYIEEAKNTDAIEQPEVIENIKFLAASQVGTIEKLGRALRDKTWHQIFELIMPDIRRHFHDPMHLKGERLRMLLRVDELDYEELRRLYGEEYSQKGQEILNQLRQTTKELAEIIRAKVPLENLEDF